MIGSARGRLFRLRLLLVVASAGVSTFIAGCGSQPVPEPQANVTVNTAPETSSAAPQPSAAKQARTTSARPALGDIPLDVWFDDPIAVSQQQGAVAAPAQVAAGGVVGVTAATSSDAAATTAASSTAESAAAGSGDWNGIIPVEILENEVKRIRGTLNSSMQGVGKYNGAYKEIRVEASVLAALAGIAIAHSEDVRWKDKAKYIRDVSSEVAAKADGLGAKHFEATQAAYEKLEQLLNGNMPADLEEAAPELDFSEVAKRGSLMQRMEKSFQFLRSNVTNEAALKSEADKAIHEATLLAALAQVISTEGYDSTDEEDYKAFVQRMLQANQDIVKAVKNGSFDAFTEANSRNQKACDECHVGYRFADDF